MLRMTRVLAIGLDGAESTYIESLILAGRLPNLARLWSAGSWCRLATEPPWHPSFLINNEFLAGRAPMASDTWDACRFDPLTYRAYKPFAGGHLGSPPFYELVPGLKTIVFDAPGCALGSSPDVVEVLAWGAHSPHHPRASRPAGLINAIDHEIGRHPGVRNAFDAGWHNRSRLDSVVDGLVAGALRRAEAWSMLQGKFPDWELALVVMSETHDSSELLWHGVDPGHPLAKVVDARHVATCLERTYAAVDEAIGRMVAGSPADTAIVVFSLFGTGTGPGDVPSVVLLPELLHRLSGAPATFRSASAAGWKKAGCPPVVPRRSEKWRDAMERLCPGPADPMARLLGRSERVARTYLRSVRLRLAKQFGKGTVGSVGYPIPGEQNGPDSRQVESGETLDWQFAARYRQWWPGMRAFVLPTFADGMVRVNLEGREGKGIVPQSEYEAACDEVEEAVRACTNPRTGRPVVRDVIREPREEVMSPSRYADVVVVWDEPTDALEHPATGLIGPVPFNRPGAHTTNAFAIVCPDAGHLDGRGTPEADVVDYPAGRAGSILDLPPTLFDLLGRPVPASLEGTSLLDVRRN